MNPSQRIRNSKKHKVARTCGDVLRSMSYSHTYGNDFIGLSGYETNDTYLYNICPLCCCRVGGVVVNAPPHDH